MRAGDRVRIRKVTGRPSIQLVADCNVTWSHTVTGNVRRGTTCVVLEAIQPLVRGFTTDAAIRLLTPDKTTGWAHEFEFELVD